MKSVGSPMPRKKRILKDVLRLVPERPSYPCRSGENHHGSAANDAQTSSLPLRAKMQRLA